MKHTITVDQPCKENWNGMSPTSDGKFCSRCQKPVIDFTAFTDGELATYFETNQPGCGRFLPSQLNREIHTTRKNNFPLTRLALGVSLLFSAGVATAQTEKPKIEVHEKKDQPANHVQYIEFIGVVSDAMGPVPGANVLQVGTANGTKTDMDGKYSIKVPIESFKDKVFLEFSFLGMESRTIEVSSTSTEKYLNVKMVEDAGWIGQVVVGGIGYYKKPGIFKRFLNLFKRK